MDAEFGATAIETSAADVTVSVVEPTIPLAVAVMALVPGATLVASPPGAIVAVAGVPDAQVTTPVRFCVVLLL
jgi:hypothetical protein